MTPIKMSDSRRRALIDETISAIRAIECHTNGANIDMRQSEKQRQALAYCSCNEAIEGCRELVVHLFDLLLAVHLRVRGAMTCIELTSSASSAQLLTLTS